MNLLANPHPVHTSTGLGVVVSCSVVKEKNPLKD